MKIASTREIIDKLTEYEKEHGIGAVIGVMTIAPGDRAVQYIFEVAGNSYAKTDGDAWREANIEKIEISALNDEELFKDK